MISFKRTEGYDCCDKPRTNMEFVPSYAVVKSYLGFKYRKVDAMMPVLVCSNCKTIYKFYVYNTGEKLK